jgi:SdrD B-like domain/Beta-propeller repeat
MWYSSLLRVRSTPRREATDRKARRRPQARPRTNCTPGLELLDERTLLSGGWAAALGTAGATSAHGVALDPSSAAVFVAGSQLAKYTTDGRLLWSKDLGSLNAALSVAVDASGESLVSGTFAGTLTLGSRTLTSAGGNDAFVAKFDPSGIVLWARSFGGPGTDQSAGIALDATGAAYVTGRFSGTVAFDNAHTLTGAGDADAFVLKLNSSGDVVYASQAGGSGHDVGIGLAVDGGGQAYATGYFAGTASFGATTLTSAGVYSGYIAQLDGNGNFTWVRQMGGPAAADQSYAQTQGVAVDGNGRVFATGTFIGATAFGGAQDGTGAASLTSLGATDAFVTSLDAVTGHFLWTKQIGGASSHTHGYGLALDAAGNVYTAGTFGGPGNGIDCDPGPGYAILSIQSSNYFMDGFVSELSPTGGFLGAWQVGASTGSSSATPTGIVVGTDGSVYTAGSFTFTARFDTGTQYASLSSSGMDGFVSRMTPGQSVLFGQVFGDANRNGVRDAGEATLSGVTVYLDANHNGKLDRGELSAMTNPQGGFSFYHLAAGTYTIREVVPSGYTLTTTAAVNVTLASSQFNDLTSFGNYKPTMTPAYVVTGVPTVTSATPAVPAVRTVVGTGNTPIMSVTSKTTNVRRLPLTTSSTTRPSELERTRIVPRF